MLCEVRRSRWKLIGRDGKLVDRGEKLLDRDGKRLYRGRKCIDRDEAFVGLDEKLIVRSARNNRERTGAYHRVTEGTEWDGGIKSKAKILISNCL